MLPPSVSPEAGRDRGERKDFHRVGDLSAGTQGAGKAVLVLHPLFYRRLQREAAWRLWFWTAAAWGWVISLLYTEATWREREMPAARPEEGWDAEMLQSWGSRVLKELSCLWPPLHHPFCLSAPLSLHLGACPAVIWPKIQYFSPAEWSCGAWRGVRRGAGGCHPARGVEPTLSSSPRVAPVGVVSGGTGCAHPAPGLSSRFEAFVSVLLSPAGGLPPPELGDVGLRAAQLVYAGIILICPFYPPVDTLLLGIR